MGIISKPSMEEYLAKSVLFGTPGFSEVLSFDHFKQILRCLVFYDLDKPPILEDSLYKFRFLLNHILHVSRKLFKPKEFLTIDESMIKYNGRHKFKVYMPLKPIKYGFKVYVTTESSSGYVLNWVLHEGKKDSLVEIVNRLIDGYEDQGYTIVMDRFYTTLEVVKILTEKGFGVYGAIMKNRLHCTKAMQDKIERIDKGESIFFCSLDKKMLLSC